MNLIIKKFTLALSLLFWLLISLEAQPPQGYYDNATGTGYQLKTQLFNIIKDHQVRLYNDLWTAYPLSDADLYYNNDGTVLDIYSENPSGTDPYSYTFVDDQCGNFNSEGQCYNREHLMPTSVFGGSSPMDSDIHHIFPTDGWVNNRRDILPFGIVNNPSYTSQNGSKRGANSTPGYSAGAFEVIDEFKGDVARALLYFGTRYEDRISDWSHPMLNNTSDQVFSNWFISLLLEWHAMDPPSERERNRNNVAYEFQGNRNPFVDRPEYVNRIWNPGTSTREFSELYSISVFPNPSYNGRVSISSQYPIESITIYTLTERTIRHIDLISNTLDTEIHDLESGFYLLQVRTNTGLQIQKIMVY